VIGGGCIDVTGNIKKLKNNVGKKATDDQANNE